MFLGLILRRYLFSVALLSALAVLLAACQRTQPVETDPSQPVVVTQIRPTATVTATPRPTLASKLEGREDPFDVVFAVRLKEAEAVEFS